MRLSVDPNDAGYDPIALDGEVKVLIDGVESRDCVTADEEQGFALVLKRSPDGKTIVLDGDEIAREVLHGKVQIVLPPPT